jgi:3-oxoadipate enol-lactonase
LPLKKINIPTDRGNFSAQLLGDKGPWVVCWPAQLNDGESMQEFARLLSRQFRVVLCDPPAIGLNQNLPYSHQIHDLVYYAHRVLTKLGIDRCHWVGHSAGGVVGAGLYGASPERIQSLTLASAPMLSQGRFKLATEVSTSLLAGSRLGRHLLASRALKEMGFAQPQEKSLVSSYLRKVLERTDPKTISSMRPLDGASVRRVFDKLRSSPPPMLILCGRHDRIVLQRDQRTVAEITQSQYADLNCGHMNLLVEPEACAHAFMRFVKTLDTHRSQPIALAVRAG